MVAEGADPESAQQQIVEDRDGERDVRVHYSMIYIYNRISYIYRYIHIACFRKIQCNLVHGGIDRGGLNTETKRGFGGFYRLFVGLLPGRCRSPNIAEARVEGLDFCECKARPGWGQVLADPVSKQLQSSPLERFGTQSNCDSTGCYELDDVFSTHASRSLSISPRTRCERSSSRRFLLRSRN